MVNQAVGSVVSSINALAGLAVSEDLGQLTIKEAAAYRNRNETISSILKRMVVESTNHRRRHNVESPGTIASRLSADIPADRYPEIITQVSKKLASCLSLEEAGDRELLAAVGVHIVEEVDLLIRSGIEQTVVAKLYWNMSADDIITLSQTFPTLYQSYLKHFGRVGDASLALCEMLLVLDIEINGQHPFDTQHAFRLGRCTDPDLGREVAARAVRLGFTPTNAVEIGGSKDPNRTLRRAVALKQLSPSQHARLAIRGDFAEALATFGQLTDKGFSPNQATHLATADDRVLAIEIAETALRYGFGHSQAASLGTTKNRESNLAFARKLMEFSDRPLSPHQITSVITTGSARETLRHELSLVNERGFTLPDPTNTLDDEGKAYIRGRLLLRRVVFSELESFLKCFVDDETADLVVVAADEQISRDREAFDRLRSARPPTENSDLRKETDDWVELQQAGQRLLFSPSDEIRTDTRALMHDWIAPVANARRNGDPMLDESIDYALDLVLAKDNMFAGALKDEPGVFPTVRYLLLHLAHVQTRARLYSLPETERSAVRLLCHLRRRASQDGRPVIDLEVFREEMSKKFDAACTDFAIRWLQESPS